MKEQINNCPIVLYTAPDGTTQLDVKLENETVWLSVEQMAMLFDRDRSVIGKHIRNAFREGELIKEEVWAKFAHTTRHGSMEDKTQTSELGRKICDTQEIRSRRKTRNLPSKRMRPCFSSSSSPRTAFSTLQMVTSV